MTSPSTLPGKRRGVELGQAAVFTLLMAVLALGSLRAMLLALPNLNLRQPVARALSDDASARAPTPERRVMVVLIDGLRTDVAREQPFLRELAERGAWADLWLETPSYSSPQWVAFLTGVPPRDSGVRTNVDLPRLVLDNVPRRVRAQGRTAIEIGDEVNWWETLFADDFTSTWLVTPDELPGRARALMPGADFLLVHLTTVDLAGHTVGAAAPGYRREAARNDATLRDLATAFGWPDATVVVLSDHGHTLHGGHGGDEPDVRSAWVVASGPGVRPGARIRGARPADVAPTLAALLGVPAPANAQGRTLIELLAVDEAVAEGLARSDRARIAVATVAAEEGRKIQLSREARRRAARGAAVVVCALALAWVVRRSRRPAWRGVAAGALCLAVAAGVYFLWFGRVSFSADRDARTLAVTTLWIATAVAAIAFAWPLAQVVRGRWRSGDTCAFALGAVVGASPLAAIAFAYAGAYTPRIVCEPDWVACGPLLAYGLFAPAAGAAALLSLLAAVRDLRRSALLFGGHDPRGDGSRGDGSRGDGSRGDGSRADASPPDVTRSPAEAPPAPPPASR